MGVWLDLARFQGVQYAVPHRAGAAQNARGAAETQTRLVRFELWVWHAMETRSLCAFISLATTVRPNHDGVG